MRPQPVALHPRTDMNTFPTVQPSPAAPAVAKPMAEFAGHTGPVVAVAFTPDRAIVVSADAGGTVRLRNLSSSRPPERGTIPATGDTPRSVACAPNNRYIALGSGTPAGLVRLYNISDSTPAAGLTLRGAPGPVLALAYSPDGKLIAGGGEDNILRVWEPGLGGRGDARVVLPGHTKPVTAVTFAPDGQALATGSPDGTARVWTLSRIRSSQRAVLPHPAAVDAVAYLPDGRSLVTACRDGRLRVWDAGSITPAVWAEFAGHPGGTRVLVVLAADRLVGAADGSAVTNWDPRTGKVLAAWDVPGGPGTAAAMTGDGRYLARGTAAGTVGVFRVADKRSAGAAGP